MGPKLVSVIIAGCPLLRGFECIEVYGDTVQGHSEMSVISQVSAVEGCPLSGVPPYMQVVI